MEQAKPDGYEVGDSGNAANGVGVSDAEIFQSGLLVHELGERLEGPSEEGVGNDFLGVEAVRDVNRCQQEKKGLVLVGGRRPQSGKANGFRRSTSRPGS